MEATFEELQALQEQMGTKRFNALRQSMKKSEDGSLDAHCEDRSGAQAKKKSGKWPTSVPPPRAQSRSVSHHEASEEEDDEHGMGEEGSDGEHAAGAGDTQGPAKKRKKSKAPMEQSSKRRPPAVRHVTAEARPMRRDPRFDELSGALNMGLFKSSFSFLEQKVQADVATLEKAFKKAKDPEERARLHAALQSMRDRMDTMQAKEELQKIKAEHRKAEAELARDGKKPFFLKKSDVRRLELLSRFETQKKSGRMDKAVQSRRKHAAAKDHRRLPARRTQDSA